MTEIETDTIQHRNEPTPRIETTGEFPMTTLTTTPPQDRPLPRSYLSEEDKIGLSQNAIYICESMEADHAGDDEASWQWLALAKIDEGTKRALIETCGGEFLKSKGFDV